MNSYKFRCQACRKEFEAKRFWAKYCSNSCRLFAWFERKKKEIKIGKENRLTTQK